MYTKEEMEEWLIAASEKVRRNVAVVTPASLGQDYLLHISSNTQLRKFVPMIGHRQSNMEDRTMPRICVCPTVLGCMIGYAKAEHDFNEGVADGKTGWKGGWKIYAFPFDVALRPNKRLVYDADTSDEMWLTTYNRDTAEYIPEAAGKMFYRAVRMTGQSGGRPHGDFEMYVEITREGGVAFSKTAHLDKGYWYIEGPIQQNVRDWKDDKSYVVKPVERAEYLSAKNQCADLLGLKETVPAYLKW